MKLNLIVFHTAGELLPLCDDEENIEYIELKAQSMLRLLHNFSYDLQLPPLLEQKLEQLLEACQCCAFISCSLPYVKSSRRGAPALDIPEEMLR